MTNTPTTTINNNNKNMIFVIPILIIAFQEGLRSSMESEKAERVSDVAVYQESPPHISMKLSSFTKEKGRKALAGEFEYLIKNRSWITMDVERPLIHRR